MSVKVWNQVWKLRLPRAEKFVLLAYADHADDSGGSIFPSISLIAEKTGYDERSIQRITRRLQAAGYLIPMGGQKGGQGVTPRWKIDLTIKDNKTAAFTDSVKISPIEMGDISSVKRVTTDAQKGDTALSSEPSIEPSYEPDEEDTAMAEISKVFEQEIGLLTYFIRDELMAAVQTYPQQWIMDAFHEAASQNKRNWKYVQAILKRWQSQGNQEPMHKSTIATRPAEPKAFAAIREWAQAKGINLNGN